MTINEFLLKTFVPEDPKLKKIHDDFGFSKEDRVLPKRPRVECADGFTFSAQAGSALYCTPRINLYPETWGDGYQEIELGYPSAHDELIDEYAEMSEYDNYTETVYGYVPVEVVDQLIAKHGGIAGEDTSNVELPDLPEYLKLKFNRFMDAYDSLCKIRYEEMHNEDKSNIPESHSKHFGYGYFLKMTHWHEWELSKFKVPNNEVLAACAIKNEPDVIADLVSAYIYEETENWMAWTIANESKEETENGNDNEDSEHSGRYPWGD